MVEVIVHLHFLQRELRVKNLISMQCHSFLNLSVGQISKIVFCQNVRGNGFNREKNTKSRDPILVVSQKVKNENH